MNTRGLLYGLDLFSGIGGNSLALGGYVDTVAYCERDEYAQAVLLSRMREGLLPSRPIWDDVRTLRGDYLPAIDIIVGGFPCQDISVAGRGEGLDGERSGLFFEIVRLTKEIRPTYLFLENVPAIRTRGLARVLRELACLRYDLRWTTVSAASVGAPHLRNRWFLLAADAERVELWNKQGRSCGPRGQGTTLSRNDGAEESLADSGSQSEREQGHEAEAVGDQRNARLVTCGSGSRLTCSGACPNVANAASCGRGQGSEIPRGSGEGDRAEGDHGRRSHLGGSLRDADGEGLEIRSCIGGDARSELATPLRADWWSVEPDVGRVAHGVSARVDRIRGLGNAVVPLQARTAFERLMGLEARV